VIGALTFLTVVGRSRPPRSADLAWFPAVGMFLGAVLGCAWWIGEQVWPPALAAALVVAADLALTGLLHVDGLADSADGLLPHLDREQRLAVMAAPDVGAFGVATTAATLLVRWSALAALPVGGWRAVVLLAAVWATARAGMVLVMATQPYARGAGGLASPFVSTPSASGPATRSAPRAASFTAIATLVLATVVSAVVTASTGGLSAITGAAGIVVGVGAGVVVALLARRRIGGYTGDVLGALGMVVETVALVVLVADA
jgi:adenosylcobinamide-GDP ribazoletransferase